MPELLVPELPMPELLVPELLMPELLHPVLPDPLLVQSVGSGSGVRSLSSPSSIVARIPSAGEGKGAVEVEARDGVVDEDEDCGATG